jgi:hypothetical protein
MREGSQGIALLGAVFYGTDARTKSPPFSCDQPPSPTPNTRQPLFESRLQETQLRNIASHRKTMKNSRRQRSRVIHTGSFKTRLVCHIPSKQRLVD